MQIYSNINIFFAHVRSDTEADSPAPERDFASLHAKIAMLQQREREYLAEIQALKDSLKVTL